MTQEMKEIVERIIRLLKAANIPVTVKQIQKEADFLYRLPLTREEIMEVLK